MHVMILRMISTTSLQAFSGATTTQPLDRTAPVRLVRAQQDQSPRQSTPAPPLPEARPSLPPPRGSLLNLSV